MCFKFKMNLIFQITLCIISVLCSDIVERPIVESPSGKYRGHVLKSRSSRDVHSFEGIPYAVPPIGKFRLKDPVTFPRMDGIYEANDDSRDCIQPPPNLAEVKNISSYKGAEDCLYLNVYKPSTGDDSTPLPVLVWIHGGGFIGGSGSKFWNGPKYLLDKDIILVTFNYRLQVLGFFSNGDKILPGNMGMKDMILVLKWVKENIASFGGNPKLVTLGGVSAGSISVTYHMHSPLSKGLFHQALAESGTAFGNNAIKTWKQAKEDANKIARYLGCSYESEQLLKCLQKMAVEELFQAAASLMSTNIFMKMDFLPVLEDESATAFITASLLNEPAEMAFLTGVASNECLYIVREVVRLSSVYNGSLSKLMEDAENVIPIYGGYRGHTRETEISQEIAKFYFGNGEFQDVTEIKLTEVFSDLMMNHGMHIAGKKEKGPTYLYKFSYKGVNPFFPVQPIEGLEDAVSHAEEFMYIFNPQYFQRDDSEWAEEDLNMSHHLVDFWVNFVKYGDPSPESRKWEESNGGVKYLDITNQGLLMRSNMFQPRMDFLDKLNINPIIIKTRHDEL